MKHRSRYPDNWKAIALQIKQNAGWKCELCGLECIPAGVKVLNMGRSDRARQRLEVHHINRKPEDNRQENLIAICSACHLRQHRRRQGSLPIGQLSLFP